MLRAPRLGAFVAALALSLACNQGLAPELASGACPSGFTGICGTVRFRGAVPAGTELVWVVAFAEFPQSTGELITSFRPLPPPQVPFADTAATYQLSLPAGRYEWVLAVWKQAGTLTIESAETLLREAGYYRDPLDPMAPGAVDVSGGRGGIDFIVDFDHMHTVSYWFPPAAPPPLSPGR